MLEFPARAEAEIAALPDGWYLLTSKHGQTSAMEKVSGERARRLFGNWRCPGLVHDDASLARDEIEVTARLVDLAPLKARIKLLTECLQDIIEYHGDYPEGQREFFDAIARAEAALNPEQNDE